MVSFFLFRLTQWRTVCGLFISKAPARQRSRAAPANPDGVEKKKSNSCAHESLDGLSPRILLRHSQTITDIRV